MGVTLGGPSTMKVLRHYMSTKKMFGIRGTDVQMTADPQPVMPTTDFDSGIPIGYTQPPFSALAAAQRLSSSHIATYYPGHDWYWGVYFTTPNLRSSGVYCRVSITYYVEFFNAKHSPNGYRGEVPSRPQE